MTIDNVTEEALRGKPFIGKVVKYTNPKDGAYGTQIDRECSRCLMRETAKGVLNGDCNIADRSAHQYFGVDPGEKLPEQLDGKEVGHYCPYFTDFRAE